jgi:nascent polypeptide-associated complex subunit beta
LPSILSQLGSDSLNQLKKIASGISGAGMSAPDDDDIPELTTENFEEVAKTEVETITQKVQEIPVS